MKFAVNYSPPLEELLNHEEIPEPDLVKIAPEFDGIKRKESGDMVARAERIGLPIYRHFPFFIGSGTISEFYEKDWVKKILDSTDETTKVNVHVNVDEENVRRYRQRVVKSRVRDLLDKDLETVVNDFGKDNVIVENMPWHQKHPHYKSHVFSSDADILSDIIDRHDVGLLLDIDHARVRSNNLEGGLLEESLEEYVAKLPIDRLQELHMTGTRYVEKSKRLQSHLSMEKLDWNILKWAFKNIQNGNWSKPDIYAFEYGSFGENFSWRSDPKVLQEQVPKIQALIVEHGLREEVRSVL